MFLVVLTAQHDLIVDIVQLVILNFSNPPMWKQRF